VQAIRQEFDGLKAQVATWPEAARPPAEAFEMDPHLRKLAEEKATSLEEQVGSGAAGWGIQAAC
jgi:hypothetical protein